MSEIRDMIDEMFEQNIDKYSVYSEKAKVTAVDESAGTCTVTLVADDAEITDVSFKTAKSDTEGIFITPEVGYYVMVTWLNNEVCFVSLVQRWSKVTIKKGSNSVVLDGTDVVVNGGSKTVAIAPEVATKLSDLETKVNDLIIAFDTHNHPTAPIGPVSFPTTAGSVSAITPTTVETDINDPNFKAKG